MKKGYVDIFNVKWKLPKEELCSTCGQPDSCGDCDHKPLSKEDVKKLGGILSSPQIEDKVYDLKAQIEELKEELSNKI